MILEILVILLWVVGGGYTAKKAIAAAERHYLRLAEEADRPQDKMDADDWCGAIFFGTAAFIAFPAVAAVWIASYPARWIYKPVRAYMLPPQQRAFEQHVRDLNAQKALVMATAKTYQQVLEWEPEDHPDRVAMLHQLQEQITEQMQQLMRIANPHNPTGFDGDYLESATDEVKALTARSSW